MKEQMGLCHVGHKCHDFMTVCCTQHLGTLSPPLHQVQAGWGDEGHPRLSWLDPSMHDCCTLALVSICTLVASAACACAATPSPGHVDARAGAAAGQGRQVGAR